MKRDLRDTATYQQLEEHFTKALAPAFGKPSHASEPDLTRDGGRIAFTASVLERLEGVAGTKVAVADTATGEIRVVTGGPHDRCPRWNPDGSVLAFLSDRAEEGVHQPYLLHDGLGEAVAIPSVDGSAEYAAWSPDGGRLLLGVAGRGAELAGAQGSRTLAGPEDEAVPDWMPDVLESGSLGSAWRRLSVHDVAGGTTRVVSREGLNIWEACWAGPDQVAAVVSEGPGEELWYSADLVLLDVASGKETLLLSSEVQLGTVTASPSGDKVAVIEAICSDRGLVAGELIVVDVATGTATRIDTGPADVTRTGWRDGDTIVWLGLQGLTMTTGEIDLRTGTVRETWTTHESSGYRYPEGSVGPDGTIAMVLESYTRFPALVLVRDGDVREVASLRHEGADYFASVAGTIREVGWKGRDGLELQGLVTTPAGEGPFPLVVIVHGGPVWTYCERWGMGYHYGPALSSRGYAVFYPNPRGGGGRGQDFTRAVLGDMGGEDAHDILAGVDAVVAEGIADPDRLAVMGGSYGGFMSAWLVTQDDRFAAAVPMAESSNWYSQHFTSNIPHFDTLFLGERPSVAGGKHFQRSPVMFAERVTTPMLHTTGALDRCTPPGQAIEFHRALVENGVQSECVIYPQEGHGVRRFPAVIDHLTRVVDFFDEHLTGRDR